MADRGDSSGAPRPHPGSLARLGAGWKRLARRVGDLQARLLLTVFYYAVLGPFALVVRLTSDPLALRPGSPRGWIPREDGSGPPAEQARRQF